MLNPDLYIFAETDLKISVIPPKMNFSFALRLINHIQISRS